jgi:choline dehydrogenase
MVYVRGHPRDFDAWAEMGAAGWAAADVLPYFKRMESWHGPEPSGWRGTDGPLHVTRGPRANPLHDAFLEAGREAGFETTPDYNGEKQEGFGPMEQTVWQGRRWSAANAYLRPAMRRGEVAVLHCLALRVAIRDGRATGVEVDRGGRRETVTARREVILAASPVNTPKLLMLSGVGPAAHLAEHGVPVVADRPGVGANLQDHLELYIQMRSRQPVTLYRHLNWPSQLAIGLRWLLLKSGLGASNQFESAAFVRSAPGVDYPDVQFHFLPLAVRYDGRSAVRGHGFQAHVGPMRSPSRGQVRLASADPKAPPRILFNYMSEEKDWIDFRRCIRLTREIFAQPAFAAYAGAEIQPGTGAASDDELDAFVREHVESAFHPCGTARLGRRDDPLAVVDPECRVIGVESLRIADSSIFPRITNGNLNAPSIMVGEKAADHILGRTPLPAWNAAPWINPRWQVSDR